MMSAMANETMQNKQDWMWFSPSKDVIDPQEKRTERLPPSKRAVFLDASLPSRSVVSGNI
jgi:hypothetical protein